LAAVNIINLLELEAAHGGYGGGIYVEFPLITFIIVAFVIFLLMKISKRWGME
jgi:large-conductance mechanosensitive channel